MAQRLMRLLFNLLFLAVLAPTNLLGQQLSPYRNLVTAVNTVVADTISGINLDVNESSPQPKHGDLNITVIDPGGGNDPYVFEVQYVPDPGFIGVDSFVLEYRYASTYPYLIYRGFRVSVMPSLVYAKTDFSTTASGTPVTINVLANDSGAWGPLTVEALPLINNGTATINSNNNIVFTPKAGFLGVAHLNYLVCDALNTCQTASVNIGVHNGLPVNDTLQFCTNKNQETAIPLTYDGYVIFQAPAHGIVTLSQGRSFRYAPTAGYIGPDHFVLKTTVNGVDYFKTFNVKVLNVQSPNLMAMDDLRFTPRNQAITFNVKDNDIGNLQVRSWSVPSNFPGTISGTSGTGNVTFTPNQGFSGVATFFYKIGNSSAPALEIATVTIVVDNLAPPTTFPHILTTPKETPMVLHYEIPYPDFDFSIVEEPEHGELEYFPGFTVQNLNGQSVSGNNLVIFTPDEDFLGDDDFALWYCAPNGECQSCKIRLEVVEIEGSDPPYCIADCTWPGDVNADGLTNNKDLLPLGYSMGQEGTARVNGSTEWYGQYSDNWNDPYGDLAHDLKHEDTDGNGMINSSDVIAINESYNQAHNLFPKAFDTGKGLPFFLDLLTGDPEEGGLVQIAISLGNENFPAIDILGFTFDITLSTGIVDSAFSMTFLENSWLNLNAPCITLAQRPFAGRFETAFSRTSGQPVSGQGIVGSLEFIIIDIIDGGGQNERHSITLNPTVMLADGSTSSGTSISLDLPVKAKDRDASKSIPQFDFTAFPSPAKEILQVNWVGTEDVEKLSLSDINGKILLELNSLTGNQAQLDISKMPSGVYILSGVTDKGVISKKVQVLR